MFKQKRTYKVPGTCCQHKPFLFFEHLSVKLGEEDVTVKVGHDVCEVNQVTPGMIQRLLITHSQIKTVCSQPVINSVTMNTKTHCVYLPP